MTMSNFTLVPPADYVAELLKLAPSFAASTEFASLHAQDRTCAGLVFSAFSRFMEGSYGSQVAMQECSNAIEHFACTNDAEVLNLLVTEVFEGFRQPQTTKNQLLPTSRQLYERWIGN
jgi:hypothetical protein